LILATTKTRAELYSKELLCKKKSSKDEAHLVSRALILR